MCVVGGGDGKNLENDRHLTVLEGGGRSLAPGKRLVWQVFVGIYKFRWDFSGRAISEQYQN